MKVKTLISAVVLCLLVVGVTPAFAATTQTANMTVTTIVAQSCTVSAGTLDFGTYTGLVSNAQATITVACNVASGGASITVELDKGQSTTASTQNPRQMKNGSNLLNYGLYTDSAHTTAWGVTADGATHVNKTLAGSGSLTVYGQIPGLQTPPTGTYNDTVSVSITY